MKVFAGILLCVFLLCPAIGLAESVNLVQDPGFEEAAKGGVFLAPDNYKKDVGTKTEYVDGGVTGKCLYIENPAENHAYAMQEIKLEQGKTYKLSAMIKSEGTSDKKGANIGLIGTFLGTADQKNTAGKFVLSEGYFKSELPSATIMAELGGYGALSAGKAWFDDISVTEVKPEDVPAGIEVGLLKKPEQKTESKQNETPGATGGWNGLFMFLAGLIVGSLIFIYLPIVKQKIEEIKQNEQAKLDEQAAEQEEAGETENVEEEKQDDDRN